MKKLLLALSLAIAAVAVPEIAASPAIDSVATADEPQVKITHGGVELSAAAQTPTHFYIYSITGQMIKSVSVDASSHTTIELPSGYYIVKCEKWSRRIVVK